MAKPQEWLVCSSLNQWHQWLEANHDTVPFVWLEITKVNSTKVGIHLEEAVIEAIRYGWIDGIMYSIDEDTFILRFTKRQNNSIWSLKNRIRAQKLLDSGDMTPAGMAEVAKAKANGKWDQAYSALDKFDLPEELEAVLKSDPDYYRQFIGLKLSKQEKLIENLHQTQPEKERQEVLNQILVELKQTRK